MKSLFSASALAAGLLAAAPGWAQDFPVTIDHGLGETVIERQPERVAIYGWMAQDVALALGIVPVGVPAQAWGGDENELLPWVTEAISELGGELPVRYDNVNVPYEAIMALEPDVILAPYSGLTPDEYGRLSEIAPTIAWSETPWTGNWQDVTLTVGRALGYEDEARQLVEQANAHVAEAAASHPEFSGRTFAFGWGEPDRSILGVFTRADSRVQLVSELGLQPAPGIVALGEDEFSVELSLEVIDSVDADVLIIWQGDQPEIDAILANPLFARFRPVAEDRLITLLDRSFVMALSAPSVLSIPYAVDQLVPELAAVLQEQAQ